jgi:hypothetical protein
MCVGDLEVVARAETVEQPLVVGRHELAVLAEQAVRTDQQQRVVEAAGALELALVDAHGAEDVVLPARGGDPVDDGTGDLDRAGPESLPQHVAVAARQVSPGV